MHRKHKANTGKEMAAMVVAEFALGELLRHDRLHAEMCKSDLFQALHGASPGCWRDTKSTNNSCKIAFLRGTRRNTKPLSPSTY
jgi:hypothetical protein